MTKFWARGRSRPKWKLVVMSMRAVAWMRQERTVSLQEVLRASGTRCPLEPPRRGRNAGIGATSQFATRLATCLLWNMVRCRHLRPEQAGVVRTTSVLVVCETRVGPYAFRSGAGSFPRTLRGPGVTTTATRNRPVPCHRAPWVRAFLFPVCGCCSSQVETCFAGQGWPHTQGARLRR